MVANGLSAPDRWVRSPDDVAYRQVRDNVTRWAREIPGLDRIPVPACPEWTVWDVVAHLVEISCKVATRSGRTGGAPPVPGKDAEPDALVRAWHASGSLVDHVLIDQPSQRGQILVMDALTHELDIRQASACRRRRSSGHARGARPPRRRIRPVRPPARPAALRIETRGAVWVAGQGEPAGSVVAGRYDLYGRWPAAGRRRRSPGSPGPARRGGGSRRSNGDRSTRPPKRVSIH